MKTTITELQAEVARLKTQRQDLQNRLGDTLLKLSKEHDRAVALDRDNNALYSRTRGAERDLRYLEKHCDVLQRTVDDTESVLQAALRWNKWLCIALAGVFIIAVVGYV